MNSKKIHVWALIIFISSFFAVCQPSTEGERLVAAIREHDLLTANMLLMAYAAHDRISILNTIVHGWTALHYAIANNFLDGVALLLDFGADPNITQQAFFERQTPLIQAITGYDNNQSETECLPIVRKLIEAKANLNFQTLSEQTALHYAVDEGYLVITTLLLLAGADPNIKGFRKTALHLILKDSQVSLEKRLNFIKILLTAGADPNIEDEDILVRLGIDHTLYKPNLTYTIRQVAYQQYLKGDSSMLRTILGLHRQAMLGTTSEKEGACNHITTQNRDFFEDVVDPSLAREIRFYMDCDEADSSIKESEAISRKKLYLYFDQDKAHLSIEQSEATLRAELTKNILQ